MTELDLDREKVAGGRLVIKRLQTLAEEYDCEVSTWDPSSPDPDDGPAFEIGITCNVAGRCGVSVSLDDPPCLVNLTVGLGAVWIELWCASDSEALDHCVHLVDQVVRGRVVERVALADSGQVLSTGLTLLDSGDTYSEGRGLFNLFTRHRTEIIRYEPYPQR